MRVKIAGTSFLFFSSLIFFTVQLHAQAWISLNGPGSLYTHPSLSSQTTVKNDTLYVIPGNGSIFKKHVESTQWILIGGPSGLDHFDFAMDDKGNYYSIDHGIAFPTEPPFTIQTFSYSEDYGRTWNGIGDLTNMGIKELFITQTNNVILGGSGIYELTNDKSSFNVLDSTISVNTIYQHKDTLIAGGFLGLSFSTDSGKNWTKLGPDTLRVQSITDYQNKILFATNDQVFVQEKLGQEGNLVSDLPSAKFNVLHTANNDHVYLGTDDGIFLIDPEKLDSKSVFNELQNHIIFDLASNNNTLFIATDAGNYQCSITSNACQLDPAPTTFVEDVSFLNEKTLLAGGYHGISSFDLQNEQWTDLESTFSGSANIVFTKEDSDFYVGIGSRIYACSFTQNCTDTLIVDSGNAIIHMEKNQAGTHFLNSYKNVFKSNDSGRNWTKIFANPNFNNSLIWKTFAYSDSILLIAFSDSLIKHNLQKNTFNSVGFEQLGRTEFLKTKDGSIFLTVGNEIYKSSDEGETWTKLIDLEQYLEDEIQNVVAFLNHEASRKFYLVFSNGHVYISDDEGENWGINKELYPLRIEDAAIDSEGKLYLASFGAGVLTNAKPLNPPIYISNERDPERNHTPSTFILNQNYPNPFNPSTTVSFELNEPQRVAISIFNVFGQKVREYNLGVRNSGAQHHSINLNNQASGVYLLKVQAGSASQSIKITLIK